DGVLQRTQANFQGGFAAVLKNGQPIGTFGLPAPWPQLKASLDPLVGRYMGDTKPNVAAAPTLASTQDAFPLDFAGRHYLVSVVDVDPNGRIIVALPLPVTLSQTIDRIGANQKRYFDLSTQRRQVRRFYMQLLLLITVLVLFAASWLSIFMAR